MATRHKKTLSIISRNNYIVDINKSRLYFVDVKTEGGIIDLNHRDSAERAIIGQKKVTDGKGIEKVIGKLTVLYS